MDVEDDVVVTGAVIIVLSNTVDVTAGVPVPSTEEVVTTGVPDVLVEVPSEYVVVVTGVVVVVVVVTGIVVITVSV